MKPELETLCAECRAGNFRRYEAPRGTQKAAKDAARADAVELLFALLTDALGAEKVSMTAKNEICFAFGDIDLGAQGVFEIPLTIQPKVRAITAGSTEKRGDFDEFDREETARLFAEQQKKDEAEKAEKARKKAAQIARDTARRKAQKEKGAE